MQLKTIAGWAVLIFIGWYIFTQPQAAGAAVHHLLGMASQAATSLSAFINSW